MNPTRKLLTPVKPEPCCCPRCGKAMQKGMAYLDAPNLTVADSVDGLVAAAAIVSGLAAAAIPGSPQSRLDFATTGRPGLTVMQSSDIRTAYRCEDCTILSIFPA